MKRLPLILLVVLATAEQGVTVIVSCGTGLIRKWLGPAWTPQS